MKNAVVGAALGLLVRVGLAWGDEAPPTAAEVQRLQTEVAQLRQELRDQKQLLLNVMQSDQQRYEVLIQLLRSGANNAALPPLPPVAGLAAPSAPSPGLAGSPPASAATGVIAGRVQLPAGIRDAFVFVEGLRGGPGRGGLLEIKQIDKEFIPRVAAVPIGSRVVFSNSDAIFHNVFSKGPVAAFDLGSIKGGETSKAVVLNRPGHLEVFCNIHSRMRSDILVVPNGYYAKVAPDGSFRLLGVPVGSRRVVLWAPGATAASEMVEVSSHGATVRLVADKQTPRPHLNKFGQVYGSYDE